MVGNNTLQAFQANTGAFPGLSLEKTNQIKEKSKLMSTNSYDQMLIQDDMYKQELNKQKHETFVQQRQMGRMGLEEQVQNANDPKTKNTKTSIKNIAALADMYRQYGYEHGKNWDSMQDEELISRFNTKNPQVKKLADDFLTGGEDSEYKLSQQLGISGSLVETRAKEKMKNGFWDQTWSNMRAMANVPIDSMKKWGQRTMNELGAEVYKKVIKNVVGDVIDGETVDDVFDKTLDKVVKSEILDYQNEIDARQLANIEKNVDKDVREYYGGKGYTKLLKEGDRKGFIYKSLGDASQNWEMPVVIAASVFQPEVGFALMATDTYARENQEAFENMLNNGADYEQAEQGAVVVGLVNAAVEVGLEKMLGGVETKASDAIRKTFMKNVQNEAAKKGLGRIIAEGVGTQLYASAEEGLEEIVQQIVQNAAVKTVNENQDLFQGIGQAFEGGFYNPMNLLAGGGNLTQNLSANKEAIRQSILNRSSDTNTDTSSTESKGILDKVTDYGAELITNTVSAQDKLYKAQEPRMNKLTSKKNLEKRRANSDRANQLIIENGYVPTNTAERLDAHKATLDKLWKQIKSQIDKQGGKKVNQKSMVDALENYIKEKKALNIAAIEPDIKALEKELKMIKSSQKRFGTDLPTLENRKQVYNDLVDREGQEASEVLKGGYRLLSAEIGKIEDAILAEVPGEFAKQKKDVGALLDTYEDVFKADMKNQRSKGVGLTEAYSRIEGISDIVNGFIGVVTGKGSLESIAKGGAKLLVGKSLAKAKDVDFLVDQGFKALAEELNQKKSSMGLDESQASSKTAKYNDKQMESLVNQLKKTGLAKDVILVDSVEDFNKQTGDNSARYELAGPEFFKEQLPSRVNEIERHLKEEYGTTDEPSHAAFIDNQGEWINGNMSGYGDYRDTDHREIAQTAFEDTDTRFNTATDALTALMAQTRLVRVNYNDGYMNIDTAYRPNWDQKESLNKFDDGSIKEINVDISDPETGRPIDSGVFESMNDAINFIERHFGYGISYLKDSNGDIAGATLPDGTVYLIKDNLRLDTPTHEFSHLLRSYAKKNSPSLFNALNKIAQDAPQELKDYVQKTYGDLSEDAFLDEVFAWRQGLYSGIKSAQTWYQRMWSTIVQIWNDIKSNFGSKYADLDVFEAYEQMGSEELMQKVDTLLKGGKEIGQGYGNTQFEIAGDIYSKNFKNWFGDWENGEGSKVVDENGNPLVVYHGGQNYHTEFKKDYIGSNFGQDSQGFFFTDKKESAEEYANNTSYGLPRETPGVVMDVYLSIKNPLIERTDYDPINLWDNNYERLLKKANANKNDGIIVKADKGESLYVAFEPNQIKSATDNVGTYDPNNPDIRYERTEGNLNDLKKEYYYVISPNYEITSWEDANVHGALDYMLEKKGIENVGNSILGKLKALNAVLPKVRNGDEVANLSPIDQFGYDLKDKIVETYVKNRSRNSQLIIKDLDKWNPGDGAYPNKTFVKMEIGHNTAALHISEFLYTKLKEEGYIR